MLKMKKLIPLLLVLICLFSCVTVSADAPVKKPNETVTCSVMTETANFIFDGVSGEIAVTPAELTVDGETRDIYIAAAMGTCYDMKKLNNPLACVQSAFNFKSKYYKLVRSVIEDCVPEGSAVVLLGHSLGGMIMQQMRTDPSLTEKYEILRTITVGSPFIMTKKKLREGDLRRFADVSDTVPKLSPALIFSRKNHKDAAFEDGGYDGDMDAAHNRSYREAEVWEKYDAFGDENGNAYFTYNTDDVLGFHT